MDNNSLQTLARYLNIQPTPPRQTVAQFAKKYYIADTAKPIVLLPHQATLLEYFFKDDRFTTIVFSTVKKSGKTALAGLVARWAAETWGPYQEIFCVANDLEQARGRIYNAAMQSIELTPGYDRLRRTLPNEWKIIERIATHSSGSTIKAVSSDYKGEAGSNPSLTLWSELWGYSCFDTKTDVLTRSGWKTCDSISEHDLVATLSPDGFLEYQKPLSITKQHYSGSMYWFNHRRCSMLITPNHRVLGEFAKGSPKNSLSMYQRALKDGKTIYCGNYWHEYASNAYKLSGYIKADTKWAGIEKDFFEPYPGKKIPMDVWMEFFGWYISEGSLQKGYMDKPYGICIGQSRSVNPDCYAAIESLIVLMGYEPSRRAECLMFYDVKLGEYLELFGDSHNKYIPEEIKECSSRQLKLLFKAYISGDGWVAGSGFQCCTKSRVLADDLVEVGLKVGYIPSYVKDPDIYRIGFSTGAIAWQSNMPHWTIVPYTGTVWCLNVPNSTLYVRREGTCYWTGNSEASKRLWEELTPVPTRKRSVRYVETYAGFEDESDLLLTLYNIGKEGKQLTHDDIDWPFPDRPPVYINERARMVMYWDTGEVARRMPWQTPEYYSEQAVLLRDNAFRRLHLNEWTSSVSAFLPVEWWDACIGTVPPLDSHTPCVLGVDAAVSGDCCAISLVSRNPIKPKDAMLRAFRIWTPPKGGTINLTDTIDTTMRDWCKRFNIVEVAYDAYQLHSIMTEATRDAIAWCRPFSQMAERAVADKQLYDLIRDRRITHPGFPEMREHIINCAAKQASLEDTKLRIVKKSQQSKIDAVIATSMASYECLRLNL